MEQTGIISFFPLIVLFIVFYFFLIKPQQKKAQQQKQMLDEMKVGDVFVLTSGIICEVDAIPANTEYVLMRLNNDCVIKVYKDAILGKYEEKNIEEKNKNNIKKK